MRFGLEMTDVLESSFDGSGGFDKAVIGWGSN